MTQALFNPNGGDVKAGSPQMFPITAGVEMPFVARQIYVGTGGDVALTDSAGNTVVHKNVPSGAYLGPFFVHAVPVADTTADDMIGYA